MNVYENIAFTLRAAKRPKEEIKRRVSETIELFDLQDIAKKKPGALSGGQQQRVSLARALVRRPNIFLLDEPLSHMDQRNRADIRARIKHLQNENKITTIYVTHDQEEAISLADRVMLMSVGEIQQFGSVDELWNRPANIFVAGFIGEPAINFASGNRVGSNSVATMGVTWHTDTELGALPADAKVIVGFRPNKTSASKKQTENGVPMTVSVVEFMGTEKLVTAAYGEDLFRVIVPKNQEVKPGDVVYISVSPEDLLVFDESTEKALY
jgi:ABC-type sugar transport system ATPase subunit